MTYFLLILRLWSTDSWASNTTVLHFFCVWLNITQLQRIVCDQQFGSKLHSVWNQNKVQFCPEMPHFAQNFQKFPGIPPDSRWHPHPAPTPVWPLVCKCPRLSSPQFDSTLSHRPAFCVLFSNVITGTTWTDESSLIKIMTGGLGVLEPPGPHPSLAMPMLITS